MLHVVGWFGVQVARFFDHSMCLFARMYAHVYVGLILTPIPIYTVGPLIYAVGPPIFGSDRRPFRCFPFPALHYLNDHNHNNNFHNRD